MNKYLKLLLKTAACVVDQSVAQVDRASDRVSELMDRGKEVIHPEDHRLRNALSFAARAWCGSGRGHLIRSGERERNPRFDHATNATDQSASELPNRAGWMTGKSRELTIPCSTADHAWKIATVRR